MYVQCMSIHMCLLSYTQEYIRFGIDSEKTSSLWNAVVYAYTCMYACMCTSHTMIICSARWGPIQIFTCFVVSKSHFRVRHRQQPSRLNDNIEICFRGKIFIFYQTKFWRNRKQFQWGIKIKIYRNRWNVWKVYFEKIKILILIEINASNQKQVKKLSRPYFIDTAKKRRNTTTFLVH